MIVKIHMGRDPGGLSAYITDDHEAGRVSWIGTRYIQTSAENAERQATAILRRLAAARSDMRYTVAHLVVSPEPNQAIERGVEQTRKDCLAVLEKVLAELGLADRPALLSFQSDGHSEWNNPQTVEHLHCACAIPHPESLKGIPLHQFKRRSQQARLEAERELGLAPTPCERKRTEAVQWLDDLFKKARSTPSPRSYRELEAWCTAHHARLSLTARGGLEISALSSRKLRCGASQLFGKSFGPSALTKRLGQSPKHYFNNKPTGIRGPKKIRKQRGGWND